MFHRLQLWTVPYTWGTGGRRWAPGGHSSAVVHAKKIGKISGTPPRDAGGRRHARRGGLLAAKRAAKGPPRAAGTPCPRREKDAGLVRPPARHEGAAPFQLCSRMVSKTRQNPELLTQPRSEACPRRRLRQQYFFLTRPRADPSESPARIPRDGRGSRRAGQPPAPPPAGPGAPPPPPGSERPPRWRTCEDVPPAAALDGPIHMGYGRSPMGSRGAF
jgi:hypothetical protein